MPLSRNVTVIIIPSQPSGYYKKLEKGFKSNSCVYKQRSIHDGLYDYACLVFLALCALPDHT